MRSTRIIRKTTQIALLCLVIGSLFGGIVGVVMAGETGFEQQASVVIEE